MTGLAPSRFNKPVAPPPMISSAGFQELLIQKPTPTQPVAPATQPGPVPGSVSNQVAAQAQPAAAVQHGRPMPVKAPDASPVSRFEGAANLLWQYFLAVDDAARARCLRAPQVAFPRLQRWEMRSELTPMVPLEVGPKFTEIGSYLITTVKMKDGSPRMVAVNEGPEGLRLDWESFAGHGDCFLDEVGSMSAGRQVLLRVEVKATSERPALADSDSICFALSHPDQKTDLLAVASRESLLTTRSGKTLLETGEGLFIVRVAVEPDTHQSGWVRLVAVETAGWLDGLRVGGGRAPRGTST